MPEMRSMLPKAKQESLKCALQWSAGNHFQCRKQAQTSEEESNGVQALSWESALRSPVLMPAYAYLNSFVDAYRALQKPLEGSGGSYERSL